MNKNTPEEENTLHPVVVYFCRDTGNLCCGCNLGPAESCGLSDAVEMMADENEIVHFSGGAC